MHPLEIIALVASVTMPLFNIPLLVKIIRRKSANDLSLWWLFVRSLFQQCSWLRVVRRRASSSKIFLVC